MRSRSTHVEESLLYTTRQLTNKPPKGERILIIVMIIIQSRSYVTNGYPLLSTCEQRRENNLLRFHLCQFFPKCSFDFENKSNETVVAHFGETWRLSRYEAFCRNPLPLPNWTMHKLLTVPHFGMITIEECSILLLFLLPHSPAIRSGFYWLHRPKGNVSIFRVNSSNQ